MKKIYERPEAEVIDLMATERIAVIFDTPDRKGDTVTDGSQFVDPDPFG